MWIWHPLTFWQLTAQQSGLHFAAANAMGLKIELKETRRTANANGYRSRRQELPGQRPWRGIQLACDCWLSQLLALRLLCIVCGQSKVGGSPESRDMRFPQFKCSANYNCEFAHCSAVAAIVCTAQSQQLVAAVAHFVGMATIAALCICMVMIINTMHMACCRINRQLPSIALLSGCCLDKAPIDKQV